MTEDWVIHTGSTERRTVIQDAFSATTVDSPTSASSESSASGATGASGASGSKSGLIMVSPFVDELSFATKIDYAPKINPVLANVALKFITRKSSHLMQTMRAAYIIQQFWRKKWCPEKILLKKWFAACQFGLIDTVRTLARQQKVDVNVIDEDDSMGLARTGLHYAAGAGHTQIIRELLAQGAMNRGDENGMTPLHYACQNTPAYLKSVQDKRDTAGKHNNGWKVEYVTGEIPPGCDECVGLLITLGNVSIDSKNAEGQTPLHVASGAGISTAVIRLCNNGARVNELDNMQRAPVHLAAWGGHAGCIEVLIAHKADLRLANRIGRTPLHVAAVYGHTEVCRLLLEAGAPIDVVNHNLNTALHLALLDGFSETARFLIRSGAETSTPNCHGETPLSIAVVRHSDVAADILNTRRIVKAGPKLFGDMTSVRYDFTYVHTPIETPETTPVFLRGYGLVHPSSKHAKDPSQIQQLPSLQRAQSARNLAELASFGTGKQGTPLFRMVRLRNRELVSHPVIVKLLSLKWNQFARQQLAREFIAHALLTLLWICVTLAWGEPQETQDGPYVMTIARVAQRDGAIHAAMVWLMLVLLFGLFGREVWYVVKVPGKIRMELSQRDYWWWFDFALYLIMILIVLPLNVFAFFKISPSTYQPPVLYTKTSFALISVMIWVRYLQFLAANRFTGPFVKIIATTIRDMRNFFAVFSVLLFGFAHGFFLLLVSSFPESPSADGAVYTDAFDNFFTALLAVFRLMIGDFLYDEFQGTSSIAPVTVFYVVYVLAVTVLLLNLLIAMLNETYNSVKEYSTREWRLELANLILRLEARRPQEYADPMYDTNETHDTDAPPVLSERITKLSEHVTEVSGKLSLIESSLAEISTCLRQISASRHASGERVSLGHPGRKSPTSFSQSFF